MADRSDKPVTPDWLSPPVEHAGLRHYVEVLRERIWIVVGTLVITLLIAILYLLTASKVYEGEAELLVSPVSPDDPLLGSLPLIRQSSDPTRDVQTAAELTMSIDVAERVVQDLNLGEDPRDLLDQVSAEPVAQSSILAITAEDSSPEEAADLANAFAEGVVTERTEELHDVVETQLADLEERAASGELDGTGLAPGESIGSELTRLENLLNGDDPTLTVATEATPNPDAVSPRPMLTLAAAGVAGIVLGIAAAFAAQALDPRLRREEQLRARYRLPILARVPRDSSRRTGLPLAPGSISPPTREAYRALRANVAAAAGRGSGPRSVLVTGSAPSEGKTTTALNLAASFALAGNAAILIEADLRRPAIGPALGIEVDQGIVSTLLEDVPLRDVLVAGTQFGPNLKLLLAEYRGGWTSELFSLGAAQRLVDEAKQLADFVIIDSPPLTAVVDTLPLARQADHVVIVTRLGVTRLNELHELGELLASNDVTPLGFALLGTTPPALDSYYFAPSRDRVRTARGGPVTEEPVPRERERVEPS
jgi:Mrp family chromosome partitioning ATPase